MGRLAFLLTLANKGLPLVCAEWQRRVPSMQTWTLFKAFFTEAHRENRMINQTALRWGYNTANMVTQVTEDQFQTCDVARCYAQPNDAEETTRNMTIYLANLATATGANRATVAALTKSLPDLTALTKAQSEELRRLLNSGHITPVPAPTQDGSATVVRGNGRQRRIINNKQVNVGRPKYKTKNDNCCWYHGYQVGMQHTRATRTERKEGHNPIGGDTWGYEFL
jgi:hypothetical protein